MKNAKFRCEINKTGVRVDQILIGRKITEKDGNEFILYIKTAHGFIMKDENVNAWSDSINDAIKKAKNEIFESFKKKLELHNNDARIDLVTKTFMRTLARMKEI